MKKKLDSYEKREFIQKICEALPCHRLDELHCTQRVVVIDASKGEEFCCCHIVARAARQIIKDIEDCEDCED